MLSGKNEGQFAQFHLYPIAPASEYELIAKQPRREDKLPMSSGMPDALFADEEVGTIALKNGEEILYASFVLEGKLRYKLFGKSALYYSGNR